VPLHLLLIEVGKSGSIFHSFERHMNFWYGCQISNSPKLLAVFSWVLHWSVVTEGFIGANMHS
jgi:hypothetical protein